MASIVAKRLIRHQTQWNLAELSDEDLLHEYLSQTGEDSQEAFRELVVRHGPMVLGVCRHVLIQTQDAEDAFQATFLVLARKGATIRNRRVLSGWLHETAYRIAMKLRTNTVRRRALERQGMDMSPREVEPDNQGERAAWNELRPVLHEEVNRLPEKYRIPLILSYLEGRTNDEVAGLLQWPVGTVKGRLSRARELLRSRLSRRGLALSAAFLMTALSRGRVFAEVVSSDLVQRTVRLALTPGPVPVPPDSPSSPAAEGPPGTDLPTTFEPTNTLVRRSMRTFPIVLIVSLFLLVSLSVAIRSSVAVMVTGGRFHGWSSLFPARWPIQTGSAHCR